MILGERYYELSLLGRRAFLESMQHAVLARPRRQRSARGTAELNTPDGSDTSIAIDKDSPTGSGTTSLGLDLQTPTPGQSWEILPLTGKAHTAFVDLLTVGRTTGNDIVVPDRNVSRSHAFLRMRDGAWYLCDAGSKNGTRVDGKALQARTEVRLADNSRLTFGGVEFRFCTANALFDLLSGVSSQDPKSTLSNGPLS